MIQALNNPYDHIWSVDSDDASFTNSGRIGSRVMNRSLIVHYVLHRL